MSITCFNRAVEEWQPRSCGKHHCMGPRGGDRDTIARMAAENQYQEPTPAPGGELRPISLSKRLAALVALIALLASAAISSWWIVTDRADFSGADAPVAAQPPGER